MRVFRRQFGWIKIAVWWSQEEFFGERNALNEKLKASFPQGIDKYEE